MLEIDGAEGGGQLLRTALTLAALSGEPVDVTGIRGARPEPGLRPQHLATVRLLADVTDATVSAVDVGTTELTFEPGSIHPGQYEVDVGTAGSVTLLFDAVLPLSTALEAPLVVTATGGTHVKWAPPMATYRRVKLPLLRRCGLQAAVDLERPGFYPVGGGEATLYLGPTSLDPLGFADRGDLGGARIYSVEAEALADSDVASRQATAVVERLEAAEIPVLERATRTAASPSPGSAVTVRLDYEETIAGFDALGERGTPAEVVGESAADAALAFHGGEAALDRHTADQVLAFLALAGGRVTIPRVTDHVATSRALLETFGFDVALAQSDDRAELRVTGRCSF